ncbi:hypothetical protein ANO11243_014130 [Dothideomycetidae sp. 11243]|nr:hypothetical protein ANO11243_014130 [fungal sp. No.11243]
MSALGLGGYDSDSDEENDVTADPGTLKAEAVEDDHQAGPTKDSEDTAMTDHAAATAALGPSLPMDDREDQIPGLDMPEVDPFLSPFSQTRQRVRMLTMPPVPNFDIPPSPPPLDPSAAAVMNKKVRHFLDLKQRGVHFNQRLLNSNALKNPGMSGRLMEYAGIEGVVQYDHAMADGLGVDVRHWAGLKIEDIVSKMEEERRREANGRKGRPREFVPGRG